MQSFRTFLEGAGHGGVPFLYPLGYQGVGQYPPEYLMALYPDALYYMTADERLQKCWEEEPFKIDHMKPHPLWTITHGKKHFVATHPKLPPGNSVPWKPIKPDPDEKLFPKGPSDPCMVSEPKCLPAHLVDKDAEKFGDSCYGKWHMPENFKGEFMKTFSEYVELREAKKWSKSNSEKFKRIECEDCERVYSVPNDEYERRRIGRSRSGVYKQFPDEDCPYCRHENDMDDDDYSGKRKARYGDHTGFAEGKKKEYAPLVGAMPDDVMQAGTQPNIPDQFKGKSVVTEKVKRKKMKFE